MFIPAHIQACDEYLRVWVPSTIWGSFAKFYTYTDQELEDDDDEDKSILEGTEYKQVGLKRKHLAIDSLFSKKRIKGSRSHSLAIATKSVDFDDIVSQTDPTVEFTQRPVHQSIETPHSTEHGRLSRAFQDCLLGGNLNKARDVVTGQTPTSMDDTCLSYTSPIEPKNVDLDYSTRQPSLPPVPTFLLAPGSDIEGSTRSKPRPSEGDACLLRFMNGGKNSDIATKAGKELLASDDEEENVVWWALKRGLMPAIRLLRKATLRTLLKMRGRKEIEEDVQNWIKERMEKQVEQIEEWTDDEISALIEEWIEEEKEGIEEEKEGIEEEKEGIEEEKEGIEEEKEGIEEEKEGIEEEKEGIEEEKEGIEEEKEGIEEGVEEWMKWILMEEGGEGKQCDEGTQER